MIFTDYFRSDKDVTWDYAKQCGVTNGVIRLPENKEFDLTNKTHWQTVYTHFTDYGIQPLIVEPMPNAVHDHIKTGDCYRDESIEKVLKMFPIMQQLGINTICFNWMAHIGWLRTKSDIIERGGATVTGFALQDFQTQDGGLYYCGTALGELRLLFESRYAHGGKIRDKARLAPRRSATCKAWRRITDYGVR